MTYLLARALAVGDVVGKGGGKSKKDTVATSDQQASKIMAMVGCVAAACNGTKYECNEMQVQKQTKELL